MKSRQIRSRSNAAPSIDSTGSYSRSLLQLLLVATLILATVAMLSFRPVTDSDYWHHLAFHRAMVEQGATPNFDQLSSTASGRPWISSGWLSTLMLSTSNHTNTLTGFLALAALGMLAIAWYRRANLGLAAFIVLLSLLAAYARFLPRPDLMSICLMVPLIALLDWYERQPLTGPRHLLRAGLMPLLFVLWANLHMLFLVGLFIAGLYMVWAVWQTRRRHRSDGAILIGAWLISAAATLINPYGWKAYWFILENARLHSTGSRINELKPLWLVFGEPGGALLLSLAAPWVLVCGWLLARQWRAGNLSAWRLAVILFLVGLALIQRRQIGIAAFGIGSITVAGLLPAAPALFRGRWAMALPLFLFAGIMGAAASGKLPLIPGWNSLKSRTAPDCEWLPCEAVDFLRQNPPPGKLFHDLYSGGFLAYHLAPQTKVFIDGRLEVYNNGVYDDFFGPMEGRMSVQQLFDKYGVESALMDWRRADQQPGHTAAILSDNPDWRLCWFSDHYGLFVKQTGGDAAARDYVAAHGYRYLNPLRPQDFMDALSDPTQAPVARAEAQRALRENPTSTLANLAVSKSSG